MAKRTHKITTTNEEIREALHRSAALKEILVRSVSYHPRINVLVLQLSNRTRQVIQPERLEGLAEATSKQVANVEILGRGTGLHWPDLDLDLSVNGLLDGVLGSNLWMSSIGGSAKSASKASAARKNGQKGGRPRAMTAS